MKRFFQHILFNRFFKNLVEPIVFAAKRLEASELNFRNRKTDSENLLICEKIFSEKKVLHGLFKGMNMRGIKPSGSNYYSKLLGTYEAILTEELMYMLQKNYGVFINIGADEGSYAVGIARLYPSVDIYTFDCSSFSQDQCRQLAKINSIQNKFVVNGCFKFEKLKEIDPSAPTLLLIDCEGCENEIITEKLINYFKKADFIVELHYDKHPEILSKLQTLFAKTHNIKLLTALQDHEIIMQNESAELKDLNYDNRKFILAEREYYTQWLIGTSL